MSSWPPARVDRGLRSALHGTTAAGPGSPGSEFPKACFGATLPYFGQKWSYRVMFFVVFFMDVSAKTHTFESLFWRMACQKCSKN